MAQGKLYIITEYAGNGNLHDYIKKQKQRLPEDMIWKLFAQVRHEKCPRSSKSIVILLPSMLQILLGLNHMHSRKILHRDIKTLNVFLDDGLNVKLGDMGVAKVGPMGSGMGLFAWHQRFGPSGVGMAQWLYGA